MTGKFPMAESRKIMVVGPVGDSSGLKEKIPGVYPWRNGSGLICSPTSLSLVELELRRRGVEYRVKNKPPVKIPPSEGFMAELVSRPPFRPGLWELMLPHQRRALIRFAHDSGALHIPAGGGKTLVSLAWAIVSTIRPTLFLTRAGARWQLAAEVAKYTTTADCLILEGLPPVEWTRPAPPPEGYVIKPALLASSKTLWAPAVTSTRAQSWTEATVAGLGERFEAGEAVRVVAGPKGRFLHVAPVVGARYAKNRKWELTFGPIELAQVPRFIFCSWDLARSWATVLGAFDFGACILDESHRAASPQRRKAIPACRGEEGAVELATGEIVRFESRENRAAAVEEITRRIPLRLAMTATPVQDRVRNLWSQLDLVHPMEWGSYGAFAKRYCAAVAGAYGGLDDKGSSNERELGHRLETVRFKVSVAETHGALPAKRREVIRLPASALNEPDEEVRALLSSRRKTAGELQARLLDAAARKHGVVIDMLAQALGSDSKVVVLTGRRVDCDLIAKAAHKEIGKRGKFEGELWAAHGGSSGKIREGIRNEFMAHKGPAAIVGTLDAWGESLSLHSADLVLVSMLPWTPGAVEQMEFRFSRLGQERPVLIRYLVAENTADEHVAQLLLDKLPAIEKVAATGGLDTFEKQLGLTEDEAIASLMGMLGLESLTS